MKQRTIFFVKYFVFWFLICQAGRVLFLLYNIKNTIHLTAGEVAGSFLHGAGLDFSITGYLMLVPVILLFLTSFFKKNYFLPLINIYTGLVSFIMSLIYIVDAVLYSFWGFRIDATPLFYLTNLKAVLASLELIYWILGIFVIAMVAIALFLLYKKLFIKQLRSFKQSFFAAPVMLILGAILILPIRGGIGVSARSISSAYFSNKQFANHAAINPLWNFGFSFTEKDNYEERYNYFSDAELDKIVAPLMPVKGDSFTILKNNRPNIIVIIVESLTAKVVGSCGGEKGYTPMLDSIARAGILFDHVYSTADRTDKGLAAVVAGIFSMPGSTPLNYPKLTQKLPFLPAKLKPLGYTTTFYYGGTLEFANYGLFLRQAGFDHLISDKNFDLQGHHTKWGAWDHEVFNRILAETPDNSPLFFKTILTLTNHDPFELPEKPKFRGLGSDTKFYNTVYYTDKSIGNFLKEASKKSWWNNTLVVITADHGSMSPGNSGHDQINRYHIPVIMTGGALAVTDTVFTQLHSQTGIASTILNQIGVDATDMKFSNNYLDSNSSPFSFYCYNEGFMLITSAGNVFYNVKSNQASEQTHLTDSLEIVGKAYLQTIHHEFFKQK